MAWAVRVCTNVAELGIDPEGYIFPLLLPYMLLGPGCWQGRGEGPQRAPNF